MILEVSLGLAVGYVEALERQLLAGWRGRLLALLQERPPLEVLADADDAEFSVRLEAENLRLRNENAALRAAARKPDKGE
jgi:hypothetical protein